jgi:hypothetical protein
MYCLHAYAAFLQPTLTRKHKKRQEVLAFISTDPSLPIYQAAEAKQYDLQFLSSATPVQSHCWRRPLLWSHQLTAETDTAQQHK